MNEQVIHSEPYVSPEGIAYLLEVLKGRSGKLYGRYTPQEGTFHDRIPMTCSPGYKTKRGAIGGAKRMIDVSEDLDWRLDE